MDSLRPFCEALSRDGRKPSEIAGETMGLLSPGKITDMDAARRHRNYALAILMIVYACNFIDRRIMGVLSTPLKQHFNFSDTELGILTGFAFAIVYTLIGVP